MTQGARARRSKVTAYTPSFLTPSGRASIERNAKLSLHRGGDMALSAFAPAGPRPPHSMAAATSAQSPVAHRDGATAPHGSLEMAERESSRAGRALVSFSSMWRWRYRPDRRGGRKLGAYIFRRLPGTTNSTNKWLFLEIVGTPFPWIAEKAPNRRFSRLA